MNNGDEEFWKPTSLARPVRTTTALVAFRHVEVYGSCGSPLDKAGKA